ncbi:EAL domain-containing protein [Sulfurimonas sp. SAG-AH-194-C21]|nr:EAL domain-containing protein [Sulfurimonas sp. SAG-AH-194-C21]MDF1883918.1 EAL domain-containing protein [Sulfurimonas sp. SAG-AH-194-C21]
MYNLEEMIKNTSNIKLLYIEDNEQARVPTLAVLSEFFKNIVVAVDGQDGLEKYSENEIDLIITDIHMPNLDGLGLVEVIRKTDHDIPIFLLSAYSDIEYFRRSIHLGVDGYLLKPIDIKQFLELMHKIVEKTKIKQELKENLNFLEQYKSIANQKSMISKTDLDGIITYANDMFCSVSQYTREELIGKNQNIIRHPENPSSMFKEMWDIIKNKKQTWKGVVRNRAKDGSSYYVDAIIQPILDLDGNILEYIAMRHNITNVMNSKRQFLDYIVSAEKPLIVQIKIESFDNLQRYYGLDFSLLVESKLSILLEENMPKNLHFKNYFALDNGNYAFVKDYVKYDDVQETINGLVEFQKYINDLNVEIDSIYYDVSILVCVSYENNVYENVKYGMKQIVRNRQNFLVTNDIAEEVHAVAAKNLNILTKVKEAIENSKIISFFQPIVDSNGLVCKYESLVRLMDNNGSILVPFVFLDIAKQGKYYTQITSCVLANSFNALAKMDCDVSINLSAIDMENEAIREDIYRLLQNSGSKAKRVTFELLEDEEMKDFEVIKTFITKVKSFGVQIAIDDFGAGYSNYERLLDFQPDIIKIDGSLVKNIESSRFSVSIVKSIILFAREQGLSVVAEYVENEKIFNILKELGVDYFQGYYFGKPALLD